MYGCRMIYGQVKKMYFVNVAKIKKKKGKERGRYNGRAQLIPCEWISKWRTKFVRRKYTDF